MFIEIAITEIPDSLCEILIALLSDHAIGFEEAENGLQITFNEQVFDEEYIRTLAKKYQFVYAKKFIQEQNWNQVWESNFEPVIIDDFVAIRAPFHQTIPEVQHEIIIMPKMSFGTGHHATTYLMIQEMQKINFANKSVFDFGTGTGILSILASQLGASDIIAIDNDSWSINNASENFELNNISNISIIHTSNIPMGKQYDIILANINKNVILYCIPLFYKIMHFNSILLVSGLLVEDETDLLFEANKHLFKVVDKTSKANWLTIALTLA